MNPTFLTDPETGLEIHFHEDDYRVPIPSQPGAFFQIITKPFFNQWIQEIDLDQGSRRLGISVENYQSIITLCKAHKALSE